MKVFLCMQKIYFGSTPLVISSSPTATPQGMVVENAHKEAIQTAINALEPNGPKQLVLVSANEDEVLEALKKGYTVIQAAGGLAYTPEQEVLLIFRRGKWDL